MSAARTLHRRLGNLRLTRRRRQLGGKVPRCGRQTPAMHLVEADDSLTQPNWRVGSQEHVALCGAELTEDTPVPDFDDGCPGCADCSRYCKRCVGVAARWAAS